MKKIILKLNKFYFVLISVIIILLLTSFYFYKQYNKLRESLKISPGISNRSTKLIDKISALTNLPKDEEPEYVKITDMTKVKNQPFLVGAKNGDIILLYKKAKLAILYDPIENRIIQSGPLILASGSATITP